jgi:polyhydroxyalkanoate synthesis regulator protein
MPAAPASGPIIVKRYARSRLYDTANCCYVSVEQLRGWATRGVAFAVIDTETGDDVMRALLA